MDQSIHDSVSKLQEDQAELKATVSQLAATVETVVGEWRKSKQTNWPVLISIAIPILGVIASFFLGWQKIIDLQNEVHLAPVLAQNAVSASDRNRLNSEVSELIRNTSEIKALSSSNAAHIAEQTGRLDRLQELAQSSKSEFSAFQAESKAKGVEIETQFRTGDNSKNIQVAEMLRLIGMLWQKSFPGVAFPEFHVPANVAQPNGGR